jgi:uncharacterized protein YlxW (UPF0749 family)
MDDETNDSSQLISALLHEVQHLTMQVKQLQQSVDSLKNRNTTDSKVARNHLGAWTIGQITGKD